MRTAKKRGYAKVNLFLDITGVENGYHMIDTVVTTIDLYDVVTVTTRKDNKICVRTGGGLYRLPAPDKANNAYKAAQLFMETFNTPGVDVTVNKNIPIGNGLGGSSADIAATLLAMKEIYSVEESIKPLADMLGSDAGYQTKGGLARLTGRGEVVESLNDLDYKLYFVIVPGSSGVNTAECYKTFDLEPQEAISGGAVGFWERLSNGTYSKNDFYNALYLPATKLNQSVKRTYEAIEKLSPRATVMSGSGSAVYGVFDSIELCEWAKSKLKKEFPKTFVTESLSLKELEDKGKFFTQSPFTAK